MTSILSSVRRASAGAVLLLLLSAAVTGCTSSRVDTSTPGDRSRREIEERKERDAARDAAEAHDRLYGAAERRKEEESKRRLEEYRQDSMRKQVEAMRQDAAEKAQRARDDASDPRIRALNQLKDHYRQLYGYPR